MNIDISSAVHNKIENHLCFQYHQKQTRDHYLMTKSHSKRKNNCGYFKTIATGSDLDELNNFVDENTTRFFQRCNIPLKKLRFF